FAKAGPFTLGELAAHVGAAVAEGVDSSRFIQDVAPLDVAGEHHISFLDNPKYIESFATSKASAAIVHPKHADKAPAGMALLISENPYLAYALVAQKFYPATKHNVGIAPTAHVDASAQVDATATVMHGAYIGRNATIGADTVISPNAFIGDGVQIGNGTFIGANATLSHSIVGNRVILHPGVHIGQDGFGFAISPKGAVKVPQLGRVLIEDDVEIGAGTCIDRGAGPDTVIGMGAKIDNLVQLGHNVRIGRFATIVSQVGISGSTEVGDGAILAGQVGVAGHLKIGRGSVIAAKSGVTNHIPDGQTYGGIPAVPVMQWRRQAAVLNKLTSRKKAATHDE
ncbi:MAG: UDP-3-O-(3-hydroxymyristoyl)glucosamine N-acyltransferase, partial [Alphaproteobacteria bacterium]|nr:UDP-3-O-(3-hydroxymyristoyl)glucosamine N-acyltransferase [Alphaproteobacteria bacterium]